MIWPYPPGQQTKAAGSAGGHNEADKHHTRRIICTPRIGIGGLPQGHVRGDPKELIINGEDTAAVR